MHTHNTFRGFQVDNIIFSLYGLVNSNDGFFKSDKQASFLLKMTGGSAFQDFSFDLGHDYGYKKAGVGAQRVFNLDSEGVVSVVDIRAKKETVIFERGGVNLIKEKSDKKKATRDKANELKSKIEALIIEIQTKSLKELKVMPEVTPTMFAHIESSILGTSKVNDFINNPLLSKEIHDLGKRLSELKKEFNQL